MCVCHARYCIETAARIELFFAYMFPSTYAILHLSEIRISPKIRALPSRTLSPSLDVINLAIAH